MTIKKDAANESSDKKKEEKIILNYLCCLVYDACGIRWASIYVVKYTFAAFPSSYHANV